MVLQNHADGVEAGNGGCYAGCFHVIKNLLELERSNMAREAGDNTCHVPGSRARSACTDCTPFCKAIVLTKSSHCNALVELQWRQTAVYLPGFGVDPTYTLDRTVERKR
jgi:hypothetical protein